VRIQTSRIKIDACANNWNAVSNRFCINNTLKWGTAVAQWLRCCVTNPKVVASIPDGVIGIFHWNNPFDCTMAPGSTQPLTEMNTRSFSWG